MAEGIWTQGRIDVGTADPNAGYPSADNFRRSTAVAAAGTAGIVISAKPGRFYRGVFQNGAATAYFVMVFDKATAPVNGDTPVWTRRLAVSSELDLDLASINGIPCVNGISIAISSTAGTLTLAVANDLAARHIIYTARN